jgi:signal transduction histidine kinase
MSASPEFIQICRAQFKILSDGLGASLCIVYLTDALPGEGTGDLVPVVAYPEHLMPWAETELLSWLQHGEYQETPVSLSESATTFSPYNSERSPIDSVAATDAVVVPLTDKQVTDKRSREKQPEARQGVSPEHGVDYEPVASSQPFNSSAIAPLTPEFAAPQQHQIALPLIYEGIMVGLLVTGRPDRFWTDHEHHQIEQIAETLGISCVMDRRNRWLENRLQSQTQHQLAPLQHDVFDDLIHQFRNPLTALRTFGKLLMRRLPTSDRNFGVAESIVRESDRLQELLTYFKTALDQDPPQLPEKPTPQLPPALFPSANDGSAPLAKTSSEVRVQGEQTVTPEVLEEPPIIDVSSSATYLTGHDIVPGPCQLPEVLKPLVDVAWAIAQDKDVALAVNIDAAVTPVCADAKGLQEVLSNLIDNAIKYTPAGGQVLIRVPAPTADRQAVIIADNGPGIPDADQVHLFERHFRGVQETGEIPGTGLGLAIARTLVEKMEGQIHIFSPLSRTPLLSDWPPASSERPGTAFIVWLKRAPLHSSDPSATSHP